MPQMLNKPPPDKLPDARRPLDHDLATKAFATILDGKAEDEDIARFLIEIADRGESADEIAAAASMMRARMIAIDNVPAGAIDVCGTGGDGQHSLNISTAVAIVVAACGAPVAKHGNRAASSKAGAADTLETLGLNLERASTMAEETLAELNIAFFFAQRHHPALKGLAPIRKKIARRTIFNLLGPLCNPARVKRQLIGIASPDLLDRYSEAVQQLDYEQAVIVSGDEGLDELSIAGLSHLIHVKSGKSVRSRVEPGIAGLSPSPLSAIKGGDANFNAGALNSLLIGDRSAYRDAVILNAAAALLVAGHADSWTDAAEEAEEAINRGAARALLQCWIELSQQ